MSLCLTKHRATKTYGGVEVQIHALLTSALDEDKWSTSSPEEVTPNTYWSGDGAGPRAHVHTVVKIKILFPSRESNTRRPARTLLTILTCIFKQLKLGMPEAIQMGMG
jgi:hypothetical protein